MNPIDPCLDRSRSYFGWLVVQNRGHSGSGNINIYYYITVNTWTATVYTPELLHKAAFTPQHVHEAPLHDNYRGITPDHATCPSNL